MHHAKAKEDPKRRFHALCDKVWREDFLREAWGQVRRTYGLTCLASRTKALPWAKA